MRLQLQMLIFPNALCCSLYERNCVCAVTKMFTKFLPANNFCQFLRVTRKRSCTSASNAQAQLHFWDDQQRALELATSPIGNVSNSKYPLLIITKVQLCLCLPAYYCSFLPAGVGKSFLRLKI